MPRTISLLIWTLEILSITHDAALHRIEHSRVRIHVPIYKHTQVLTVVKKVPVPVAVPVKLKPHEHFAGWPEKSLNDFYE